MEFTLITGVYRDSVHISDGEATARYIIGYNCSWNRRIAQYAHQDVVNAKKYGWSGSYREKPFIGDILANCCPDWDDVNLWSGHNVFTGKPLTTEELGRRIADWKFELSTI